jgi:hypothetical protein
MSPFLTIAYFTKGNQYEKLSENLSQSCSQFRIPLHLKPIENLGTWEKNTHFKANFILDCLSKFNQNLVYVDVDAVFRDYPILFETIDCDVAYRTENFRWRKNEALSGTIFLRNNDRTKTFVQKWIETNRIIKASKTDPDTWEQRNMQRALEVCKDVKYENLPPEYTFIFDHSKRIYPEVIPVIEHFQASRKADI